MLTLTQDDVRLDAHASNKVDAIRQVAKALADAGLEWTDMNPEGMVATPMDVLGQDRLLASRLRVHGRRISLWLTGDGLRMMAREAVRHAG